MGYNISRKINRIGINKKEKYELKKLEILHNVKPTKVCPICRKKSLFFENEGNYMCVRCHNKFSK